jgi:crotonobetainyl-CoA:carnitine CoA-transferase CaiB-like acyl-CoA transferase
VPDTESDVLLAGLTVVDLSPTRVGAQMSQLFADHGADVVWVEPPGGGPLRREPAFPFWARGKRSVALDLRDDAGREGVRELAASADVLIETFRPGVMDRLGLGYDDLARVNPRLVYASVTGFGRQGPYANVKGYEGIVQAKLGSFASFRKITRGARPPFVTAAYASFAASHTTLHGVLAALIERERSGVGQQVEGNLVQGFTSLDSWNWFVYLVHQRWPEAFLANDLYDADGTPAGVFPFLLMVAMTRDGRWLQFAQVAPRLFLALMRALELEHLLDDPEWKGIPMLDDADKRRELWATMQQRANAKTLGEWEAIFAADPDVYAELFRSGPEVLDHPQLVHDGHVLEISDPEHGAVRQPGLLVHADGQPDPELGPPPASPTELAPLSGRMAPESGASSGEAPRGLPLEGVTVLEFAGLFAAPFGTTLLTDLGARVIHVEAIEGDPIRNMMPFPECAGVKVMQGKESLCIDITQPEGLAIIHALVPRVDVVMQGFRAGAAERHGIGPDALRALNPDLVYLSSPGYGTGGPNGHRPAYAPSIGAAGGIARANVGGSVPERPDLTLEEMQDGSRRMGAAAAGANATADGLAALGVGTAVLVGVLGRARGARVEPLLTTMVSTVAHAMSSEIVTYDGAAGTPSPGAELRGFGARYRIYDALDGEVFLAAPGAHEWVTLADALAEHVDLRADPRFATESDRVANDAALVDVLTAVFATRSSADWERDLLAADCACVAVTMDPLESVMLSEDFGRASGYIADVVHPTFDEHPRLAPTVRFSRSTTQAGAGQLKGAHTDAILEELGYDEAARADLRDREIVA